MHVAEPGRKRAARSFGNHLAPRAADTPRQLDPRYTDYASQPTWGPDAPGAVRLGDGGYRAPCWWR
jgi:hypothetical protein